VIGWVTSGGYAHYVDRSLAQGYIPRELAGNGSAFEIEILGERRAARLQPEPLFDPTASGCGCSGVGGAGSDYRNRLRDAVALLARREAFLEHLNSRWGQSRKTRRPQG
jgi:hypothetical protein